MANLFDVLLRRHPSCKERLEAAAQKYEQSFRRLVDILDREPENYTPIHGVSLAKASDRKRK